MEGSVLVCLEPGRHMAGNHFPGPPALMGLAQFQEKWWGLSCASCVPCLPTWKSKRWPGELSLNWASVPALVHGVYAIPSFAFLGRPGMLEKASRTKLGEVFVEQISITYPLFLFSTACGVVLEISLMVIYQRQFGG